MVKILCISKPFHVCFKITRFELTAAKEEASKGVYQTNQKNYEVLKCHQKFQNIFQYRNTFKMCLIFMKTLIQALS